MSNIVFSETQLFKYLEIMDNCPDQNIMLVGRHGIGKSEILTRFYESKGIKVIPFFLGQMSDPGDLIGLPMLDAKNGKTEFMPSFWFPTDNKPVVLFFDELNRARPEILQVIMDLALNKKLAGRKLPAGSRVISAVNYGAEYNITDLDPALVSRFNIVEFSPTVSEWLNWAEKNGLDERVKNFIRAHEEMLDGINLSSSGLNKTPDRRGWKKVSDLLLHFETIDEMLLNAVASIIGCSTAVAFSEWIKSDHLPTAEYVLTGVKSYTKELGMLHLHELAALTESVLQYLNNHVDNPALGAGLEHYVQFLANLPQKGREGVNKSSDAIQDFINQVMENNYQKVMQYIMVNAKKVSKIMMDSLEC